jgi:hypothetical protein
VAAELQSLSDEIRAKMEVYLEIADSNSVSLGKAQLDRLAGLEVELKQLQQRANAKSIEVELMEIAGPSMYERVQHFFIPGSR